jgi:hypothetical protein
MALLCLGFGLLFLFDLFRRRSLKPSAQMGAWLITVFLAGVAALLQGGVLSDVAAGWLARLTGRPMPTYHTFQFSLAFPPALIDGHLGQLSLFNPYQLLAACIEVGPILLALPLLAWWGVRAFRAQRWYEVVLVFSSLLGGVFLFAQFSGEAGPTALIRVQNMPVSLAGQVVLPLLWLRSARFSSRVKTVLTGLLASTLLGGIVLLGVQLISIPKPVASYFLNDLDAQASRDYWDKLPPKALIFDPSPSRAPVLFGRFTDAGLDYFHAKPQWDILDQSADPVQWRAYGFTYAYLDRNYFESLSPDLLQKIKQASCMQLLQEYTQSIPEDYRRLYDINRCQ